MKSSHKELYLICSVIFLCFSIFMLVYLDIQHRGYQEKKDSILLF